MRKPAVFLFDEPLSNLDAKLRVQMRTEISRLHSQLEATMIYVTHDQVEAMTMGDRIVVLKDGEIQQVDTPLALYGHPANAFVAGFIGSPSMNFVSGHITDDGQRFVADGSAEGEASDGAFVLPLETEDAALLKARAGQAVTLGIRPEDFYVTGSAALTAPSAVSAWVLDVTEPMGNEIVIYIHLGSGTSAHDAVARVAPQQLPEPGQAVELALDLTKLHFFDPETGLALRETHDAELA